MVNYSWFHLQAQLVLNSFTSPKIGELFLNSFTSPKIGELFLNLFTSPKVGVLVLNLFTSPKVVGPPIFRSNCQNASQSKQLANRCEPTEPNRMLIDRFDSVWLMCGSVSVSVINKTFWSVRFNFKVKNRPDRTDNTPRLDYSLILKRVMLQQ